MGQCRGECSAEAFRKHSLLENAWYATTVQPMEITGRFYMRTEFSIVVALIWFCMGAGSVVVAFVGLLNLLF